MPRKFGPKPLFKPKPKLPKGLVLPKPGDVRPGTVRHKDQMSLFDPPKRTASFVEQPLSPELALQLLDQKGDQLNSEEQGVLRLIGAGFALNAEDREILNSVFARLEPRQ